MNLMFRSSSVPISPAADGRAADRRFRLRRGGYKWALTAHIVSSVGWFGVALVVAFCVLAASMTGNSSLAHSLYRTIELFPWLSVPIGILAAATGAFLALGTSYGLIRRWWVVVKIVIATAVVTTDTVLVGRFAHTAATTGHARPSLLRQHRYPRPCPDLRRHSFRLQAMGPNAVGKTPPQRTRRIG
jgi:uncharacterized membrane protein